MDGQQKMYEMYDEYKALCLHFQVKPYSILDSDPLRWIRHYDGLKHRLDIKSKKR